MTRWSLLQVIRGPGSTFIRQLNGAVSSGRNLIGPPDPVSNIRPIKRRDPRNDAEKALHKLEEDIWKFNHNFWSEQNSKFDKVSTYPQSVPHSTILWQCKALFIEKTLSERRQQGNDEPVQKLTANELSAFYKQFLNERYGEQAMYFRCWFQRNVALTWLLLKVRVYNLLRRQK
ncbi:hypothetical protein EMCRGX_G032186 [Ephydatia muelleri]